MTTAATYPVVLPRSERGHGVVLQILAALFFVVFLAQVKIPLGFTPIPLTLQIFGLMIVGAYLGSGKGTVVALLYLLGTQLGLPFAPGWSFCPGILFTLKGGYYLGMVLQTYLVGLSFEKYREGQTGIGSLLAKICLSSLLLLATGTAWLALFIGAREAFYLGFLPFLPGDFIKCIAALLITTRK